MDESQLDGLTWWRAKAGDSDRAAGVSLRQVWLNHVGMVALAEVKELGQVAQEALAALLRVVLDSARQIRHSRPLLGIVVPMQTADSAGLETSVRKLARDQDWHRGDFVLHFAPDAAEAMARVRSVLLPFEGQTVLTSVVTTDPDEQHYRETIAEHLGKEVTAEAEAVLRAVAEGREPALEAVEKLEAEALGAIDKAVRTARASSEPTDSGAAEASETESEQ